MLNAQAINGTLAKLAKPLDSVIQILLVEVGYLIYFKDNSLNKRPIQGHNISNITLSTTTIIMPENQQNLY